jgi:hypothetical protein
MFCCSLQPQRTRHCDIQAQDAVQVFRPVQCVRRNKPHARPPYISIDAINSGVLLCTAPLVTLLQDNVWLPANFISHTLDHFRAQPRSLLGYVELRFDPPTSLLNRWQHKRIQLSKYLDDALISDRAFTTSAPCLCLAGRRLRPFQKQGSVLPLVSSASRERCGTAQ